jgi:hypothetical protein
MGVRMGLDQQDAAQKCFAGAEPGEEEIVEFAVGVAALGDDWGLAPDVEERADDVAGGGPDGRHVKRSMRAV